MPALAVQDGMAAADRRYGSGEQIPWIDEAIPILPDRGIEFYDACYEYYANGAAPLVPITDTRELMRVLDLCRQSGGG
jgi:hypothetical protein